VTMPQALHPDQKPLVRRIRMAFAPAARASEARALRARAQTLLEQSSALASQGVAMLHEQGVHAEALDLMQRHVTLFNEGMALFEQARRLHPGESRHCDGLRSRGRRAGRPGSRS